jgi:hypothetical protein
MFDVLLFLSVARWLCRIKEKSVLISRSTCFNLEIKVRRTNFEQHSPLSALMTKDEAEGTTVTAA